ncbi:MAG: hypothetical protein DCC55_38400, partial [Chloroflexi bacterium]
GYAVPEFWREAIEAGYWQDGRFYSRTGPYSFGSPFDLPNHPVVGVSWYEAVAFTHWLTEHLRAAHSLPPDLEVRLPTASEWEKAARGGLYLSVGAALVAARTLASAHQLSQANPPACHPNPRRLYPWGDEPDPDNANCEETEINTTSPVGAFTRGTGPYGAAELSGNVWEWLLQEPGDLAGGAYWNDVGGVTSAARFGRSPAYWGLSLGFRCVVVPISREPF